MGVLTGKSVDAGHSADQSRANDPDPTRTGLCRRCFGWFCAGLIWCSFGFLTYPAFAENLRIATFGAAFSREGPGLLLRDILAGDDLQVGAASALILEMQPDILVLTEFDFDLGQAALSALADSLRGQGLDYPHQFSLSPNSGLFTGLDLDGNGEPGEARDAMGYGRFAGDGGLAILSRWPIDTANVRDFTDVLWQDLPGAVLPVADGQPFPSAQVQAMQRLSSTGHWSVPIIPGAGPGTGPPLTLLVWTATPPVFDGPEDRNGLRNRDELRLWQVYLDGGFGPPPDRFVIVGNANLDPDDGGGIQAAMADFLADPRLQDPAPRSAGGSAAADADQTGDPALDTADWPDNAPGNLRVSYVLPAASLKVTGAGVFWPGPGDPKAALLGSDGLGAGPHRLVWVDLDW